MAERTPQIYQAEKVNVPLLIVGNVDQRVPLDHARKYLDALDRYN